MIKEVKEVSNVGRANELLKEGWTILNVVSNSKPIYIMAFYEKKDSEQKQGQEQGISKREYEMKTLKEACTPVVNYLKRNWDPHCTVVLTDSQIKVVRDEMGLPVETAQEVPVQEQYVGKCNHCSTNNKIELPRKSEPKFCMN